MKLKNKLWLIIYIFCFLFAPPFITFINFLIPLSIFSLFVLFFKYHKKFKDFLNRVELKKIILILLTYFGIYLLNTLIHSINAEQIYQSNYILNIYTFLLNFPLVIICSMYLVIKFDENNLTFDDMVKYFIYAGFIQAVLAIIALLIPFCRQWMLTNMLNANNEKFLNSPWVISRRFYGFSNSMLDLFGFGTGIIAALPLFYANSTGKNRFLLLSPILLIVPILNSRTGILIMVVGIICFVLGQFLKKNNNASSIFKYLIIFGLLFIPIMNIIQTYSPDTISWIKNDFLSFTSTTNTSGTADILFNSSWWQLPPSANDIVFGTGYSISGYSQYASSLTVSSDVGYINEVWKSGIIGLTIMLVFLFYITKTPRKKISSYNYKSLFSFFLIASLIMLIKGYVFAYNPGNVVIYTLSLMIIYNNKKSLKKENK